MRKVESTQFEIGGIDIEQIHINPKALDAVAALLIGLQHLYVPLELLAEVFELLEAEVNPYVADIFTN